MEYPTEEYDEIITEIHSTYTAVWELSKKLRDTQNNLYEEDIRIYFFVQIYSVLTDTIVSFMLAKSLHSSEWWKNNLSTITIDERPKRIKSFEKTVQLNIIYLPFSLIEDAFRQLIRVVKPGACKDGKSDFGNIYRCLFKELNVNSDETESLLKLYRLARNCQHNNGFYFPVNNSNSDSVTYRGIKYDFPYGKKVIYKPTLPILTMITDIAQLFWEMCETQKLKSIPFIKQAIAN